MSDYYLAHAILNSNPKRVLNEILKSGYLLASDISGNQGMSYTPLEYIHFSLFKDKKPLFERTINLFISSKILYKRSFRYAFRWVGTDISSTIKVNPRKCSKSTINRILNKINKYTLNPDNYYEILIKNKVNLHKYLVAISPREKLGEKIINFIHKNYPNILILDSFPESSSKLNYVDV